MSSEAERFPCPTCGADRHFDPQKQALCCTHCDAAEAIPQRGQLREFDLQYALSALAANQHGMTPSSEQRQVQCGHCGAQATVSLAATRCAFCDHTMLRPTDAVQAIQPEGVAPFAIDLDRALQSFRGWVKSRWFAPSSFSNVRQESLVPCYVAFWTFDAHVESDYSGERGDHYWDTERYHDGKEWKTRQVRKTRWRSVSGHVQRTFDDLVVAARDTMPAMLLNKLSPTSMGVQTFDPKFLAGMYAELHPHTLEAGFHQAKATMDGRMRSAARSSIGGDEQRVHSLRSSYSQLAFKPILLPYWLLSVQHQGHVFRVVVDGRTGQIEGQRPYSAWKIALAIMVPLVIGTVIAAIAYLARR